MAKRFTDTDKWKKRWFRTLKNDNKVFWMYLLDQCDHAGIWDVDFELASYFCNGINEQEIRTVFRKQYQEFDGGRRWFVKDFIDFQYGTLNHNVNAHKSVISILNRHSLVVHDIHNEQLMNSSFKDKDKDIDKVQVKYKDIRAKFDEFWSLYDLKIGRYDAEQYWWGKKKLKNGKCIGDEERVLIIDYVPKYAETSHKDGGYPARKHPKTFLYNSGWEDEIILPVDSSIETMLKGIRSKKGHSNE